MKLRAFVVAALFMVSGLGRTSAQELGSIDFPTSGSPAAQPLFIKGVLLMHSFEYDDAREAFVEAQKADPAFAMAYWGEAMTYNHAVWQRTSPDLARAALAKLAPTADARRAKAQTEKEKDWLGAVEKLYGAGASTSLSASKLERDLAYADAMKRMSEKYPNDDEIKSFFALAISAPITARDSRLHARRRAGRAGLCEEPAAPRRRALPDPCLRRSDPRAARPALRRCVFEDCAVGVTRCTCRRNIYGRDGHVGRTARSTS